MSRAHQVAPRLTKEGHPEFRFKRAGYTLAIDIRRPGAYWITVSIWMRNANPSQPVYAHANLSDCYLRAGGEVVMDLDAKTEPTLWVNGAGFELRAAEYESLRDHLVPIGVVHHVPASSAVEASPVRQQAPAPLSVDRGEGRRVRVSVPENDRTYEGEVDGCGGDAVLDRTIP